MKGLLFLLRVAFLCNILFLICLWLRSKGDFITNADVKSTVGVLGWFLAPFINLAANISYAIARFGMRNKNLPLWIGVGNFGFLLLQAWVWL